MSQSLLFSIIIPTYNRANFIRKTVLSVLAQTYPNFELIIIDDGSTDGTAEVIASLNDHRIQYVSKINEERAVARNVGVRLSKGDYVTFLDSDDLFKPEHLEIANLFIQNENYPEILHLGFDIILPNGNLISTWDTLPDPANEKLLEGNFLSCLGIFIKREIIIRFPFNEYKPLSGLGEDYELWIRLAARYPIRTCSQSTAYRVNHEKRGVLLVSPDDLKLRCQLLRNSWSQDSFVVDRFRPHLRKLYAYLELYSAIHLAISRERFLAFKILIRASASFPPIFLNYRFWVVIKKIIWFS